MNAYQAGPMYPAPPPPQGSGATPVVMVLLWVFVGWPVSWLLLFLFMPLGIAFGVGITIALIVVLSTGGRRPQQVVVNVPPPLPPAPVNPRQEMVRREVESIAVVTPIGGCGWCGSIVAHVNGDGHAIPPRYWHSAEIEERIRTRLQS